MHPLRHDSSRRSYSSCNRNLHQNVYKKPCSMLVLTHEAISVEQMGLRFQLTSRLRLFMAPEIAVITIKFRLISPSHSKAWCRDVMNCYLSVFAIAWSDKRYRRFETSFPSVRWQSTRFLEDKHRVIRAWVTGIVVAHVICMKSARAVTRSFVLITTLIYSTGISRLHLRSRLRHRHKFFAGI